MKLNPFVFGAGTALAISLLACGGGGTTQGGGPTSGLLGSVSFNISGAAQAPVTRQSTSVTITGIAGAFFSNFEIQDQITQPIIFTSAEDGISRLYVMNQTSGQRTRLLITDFATLNQFNPSITPKGDQVYFDANWGSRQVIMSLVLGVPTSTNFHGNASATSNDINPTCSPDGQTIALVSDADGNKEIWLCTLNTSTYQKLTNTSAGVINDNPSFSPDGRTIYYNSNVSGNQEIYAYHFSDGTSTRLTNNIADDIQPSVSPNGLYVIWSSNRTGNYDIFRMFSLNGVLPTQLTTDTHDDKEPSYSPDGSKIIFSSNRDDTAAPITDEVYLMQANGSAQTRVPIDSSFNQRSPLIAGSFTTNLSALVWNESAGLIVSQTNGVMGSVVLFDTTDTSTAVREQTRVVADALPSTGVSTISYTITTSNTLGRLLFTKNGATLIPTINQVSFAGSATNALVTFSASGALSGQVLSVIPYGANRLSLRKSEQNGILTVDGAVLGAYDSDGKNLAPNGASSVQVNTQTGQIVTR